MAFEIAYGISRLVKNHILVFTVTTPYNLVVCFSIFHCQITGQKERGSLLVFFSIPGTRQRSTRCHGTEYYNVKVHAVILHNC
jgi:hypothetical protein